MHARNVVVTGGSRGLGLATAQTLARSGFNVVAIARSTTPELDAAIASMDGKLHLQTWDLADTARLSELARSVRGSFGPIYGLVNNAGIGTTGILSNMSDADIERLVRLNVISPLTLTKYVVRSMMTAGTGRVVNISSIVSFTGYSGLAAYSATKASLLGFTRSLAREVGPLGITVNAVAPGYVDTDMTHALDERHREQIIRRSALRRMPTSNDVANTIDFLFSDKADNITGTVITVDAGNTA